MRTHGASSRSRTAEPSWSRGVDGGPQALFGRDIADQLEELMDRADRDPGIRIGQREDGDEES